ncbi:MAG: sodium/proline symporter, partial [Acidobacteriota bacterium]|nr:sodium/proline symporter [Acidobacteriota bacterium]
MNGTLAERPVVVLVAAASVLLSLAIGMWAMRRTRDARDFFIAGQRLGLVVTGLATTSAAFSGFVFLGGPGLTYRIGVASLWIVVPVGFTAALMCWVVAGPLRRLSGAGDVLTIPDVIACRFAGRAPRGCAAIAVLFGTTGYLGSQLLALGIVLSGLVPAGGDERQHLAVAIALGAAIVLAYSVAGGMVAGAYTDVLQGVIMVVAAASVFASAIASAGGITELGQTIAASPRFGAAFLEPFGTIPAVTALGFLFVFGVGPLGQPHVLHKFYMLRDPAQLKWMPLVIGSSQSLCLLVWIGVGLAVPALVASGKLMPLEDPDRALPAFVLGHASDLLAGLVLAGVLAAIMSTADSFVNIGSAALVRDLPRSFGLAPRR